MNLCYDCGEEFPDYGECPACGSGNIGKLDLAEEDDKTIPEAYDEDDEYEEI